MFHMETQYRYSCTSLLTLLVCDMQFGSSGRLVRTLPRSITNRCATMRSASAWLLLLLPASLAERSLHYPFDTSRRALQHGARDANICANIDNEGIGRTKLVAHTGTLSDDQQGKVNCAKGGCGGRDPEGGKNKNGYSDNLDCGQIIHAPAGYTINLRFTYMALETSKTCKKPGCDTVTVYDGPSVHSRVLGVFSGLRNPPPIKSTGTDIFIRFQTDVGNYGFQQGHVNKDPGFYVDWHFVKHVSAGANKGATGDSFDGSQVGGVGICPAKSILTDAHGVIHDDEVGNTDCSKTNTCGSKGGQGYADNLNCYTTIHAPKGETIEFTFTQMNLEGPVNHASAIHTLCTSMPVANAYINMYVIHTCICV
jgi:hypothetical protein